MSGAAGIATSDPRATDAGAQVLADGGNCVDAAVAAALVLFVVEPHHCGPGGDAFLLAQRAGDPVPVALDGAGAVPAALVEALGDGHDAVPAFGARSVTVPGAPALLETATVNWGTRSLEHLAGPAVALGTEGFEVRPSLADACAGSATRIGADPVLHGLYFADGHPVRPGDRIRNPRLAQLIADLGDGGADGVYRGEVAREIASVVCAAGGYLETSDLASHQTLEVTPVSTEYRGTTVWQLPMPTQGPAVLHALDRLSEGDADGSWNAVADAICAGLRSVGVDLVGAPWRRRQGGTSHIAAVDADGGMASFITSVFAPFGSGVGVEAMGGPMQNRAAGFLLVDRPPGPGKPPHTIIPGLVTRGGAPEIAVGVAGGLMQAQGQVQLLVRLLADGDDPATAITAPRLRVVDGGLLALEEGHPLSGEHPGATDRPPGDGGFGCAQITRRLDGAVTAAADHRRGGAARVVQPA